MPGINVVGVQFRKAGKIYDFNSKSLLLRQGDKVVVETERGLSLAEVKRVHYADVESPEGFKPVVRIATDKDLRSSGRLTEERVTKFTKDKIKDLKLDMRLINVEIQFGGNKAIIFFSAPGRVDFRELVKELATGLKTRVELKQVGARDEAKQAGGLGICGREFCCSSFLREFVPVSIKMAKNQNLALNPSKVSGGCGRLLCCLTYEDETYSALRQKLPPKGARVKTSEGILGDVVKGDILNQVVMIETDTGEQLSVKITDIQIVDDKHGVSSDWGDDLDLDSLMGSTATQEEISALEDEPQKGNDKGRKEGPGANKGPRKRNRNRNNDRRGGNKPDGQNKEARGDGNKAEGQKSNHKGGGSRGGKNRNRNRNRNNDKRKQDSSADSGQKQNRDRDPKKS